MLDLFNFLTTPQIGRSACHKLRKGGGAGGCKVVGASNSHNPGNIFEPNLQDVIIKNISKKSSIFDGATYINIGLKVF